MQMVRAYCVSNLIFQLMKADQNSQGDQPRKRITINGARRMLGMIGKNYSDDDIQQILDCLYSIAEESYDAYRDKDKDPEE